MFDTKEEEIEVIEIFDKSRNIMIETFTKPKIINSIDIDTIINETVMSKFYFLILYRFY